MAKGALDGLRVVELGNFLAAPYCTMILADLGAEVIKIEPPGMGDSGRKTPPFVNGESAGFMSVNRNKLGVTTNLKTEAGVEIARRLAASSDVLVENLRLRTLAGFGLGYEDLSKLNQELVYCSCSGFGQEGSHRDRAGLDLIGQGMSGIISVTGEPGGAPMRPGIPVVDLMTATFAACSILAALRARSISGKGQYIDIDLFSTGLAASPWETAQYLATGEIPGPLGSAHRILAPYQVFAASDGHFTVGVVSQRLWLKFCRIAGLEYLVDDPRFADNAARKSPRVGTGRNNRCGDPKAPSGGLACRVRGGRNSGRPDQRLRPGARRSAGGGQPAGPRGRFAGIRPPEGSRAAVPTVGDAGERSKCGTGPWRAQRRGARVDRLSAGGDRRAAPAGRDLRFLGCRIGG